VLPCHGLELSGGYPTFLTSSIDLAVGTIFGTAQVSRCGITLLDQLLLRDLQLLAQHGHLLQRYSALLGKLSAAAFLVRQLCLLLYQQQLQVG